MDIIVLREQYGVARRCLNVVPMRSDTKSEPRHTGGLTAYFTGENAAYTESDTGTDSIGLVAQKITAMSRFSNELDAGSVIDFGDRLVGEISYAFANKEDQCAFNGDGTSTYGGMTGILTQLGTLTASATVGSLVPGAGSSWSTLTLEELRSGYRATSAIRGRAWSCKWIAHKTFAWTVMKSLANAAGGNTSADITSGPGMTFLGYPVEVSQVFPSATASGQIPVVFGNFRQAGMLGDRRQETISFSDTATVGGQSVWERDQIAVKGSQRFDIVIHDFGSNSVAGPIVGLETT
jgi:HK97 family phage major capsid protein